LRQLQFLSDRAIRRRTKMNAVIKIAEITDKGRTVTLVDSNKQKFTIWKQKKDGTETQAYGQLKSYSVGEETGISYNEEDDSFTNDKNQLINYKKRTILGFLPPGIQAAKPKPAEPPKGNSKPELAYEKQGDNFWDKKAYKQCLWNYWLEQTPGKILTKEDMDMVWEIFKGIEADAERRFSGDEEIPPLEEARFEGWKQDRDYNI